MVYRLIPVLGCKIGGFPSWGQQFFEETAAFPRFSDCSHRNGLPYTETAPLQWLFPFRVPGKGFIAGLKVRAALHGLGGAA
jgi:hypothetical protein